MRTRERGERVEEEGDNSSVTITTSGNAKRLLQDRKSVFTVLNL